MGVATSAESATMQESNGEADGQVNRLFDAHQHDLYRFARRLSGSHDEARDLVQETFIRVVRARTSLPDGHEREQAWLFKTVVNLCRDRQRRASVRLRLGVSLVRPESSNHSEARLVARLAVQKALSQLDARRRAIVVLHDIQGESVKRIGHLLGIAPGTVRWHLFRARRQLSTTLA
jgi:RNA polymerase sigma-70 factor (ECF subfamily)